MIRQKHLADNSGTSMLEFAVILPVFIFLLIGVIEVSRYAYFAILASHAARAGAQFASYNGENAADASTNGAGTRNAALTDAQNLSNFTEHSSLSCTIGGAPSTCPSNTANAVPSNLVYYVQVQVSGTFHSLLNYPGIPTSIPISATATMPVGSQ